MIKATLYFEIKQKKIKEFSYITFGLLNLKLDLILSRYLLY